MKKAAFLLFFSICCLAGCAPKISVVDEEVLRASEVLKNKDEFYVKAYSEGYEACNKEWFERLKVEVENLKRQKIWNKYLEGGYVKAPLVAEVFVPAKVSDDGKTLSLPRIEYVIVDDARFEARNLVERLTKQATTVFLGLYFTKEEAELRLQEVEKYLENDGVKDKVELKSVPTFDGSGLVILVRTEDKILAQKIVQDLRGQVIY